MAARNGMKLDKLLYADEAGADELYTGDLELMGTWEVAHYLGIEKSRIARWLDKGAIEPPAARLKSGPFWTLRQVRAKAHQMYRQEQHQASRREGDLDRWLKERRERRRTAELQAA